jgi:hypothetical protein
MDVLLPVIVGALGVSFTLNLLTEMGLIRWGARARARLRRAAARAAGLSDVEESRGALAGQAGPLRVRLSNYGSGPVYGTRIVSGGAAGGPQCGRRGRHLFKAFGRARDRDRPRRSTPRPGAGGRLVQAVLDSA